MRTLEHSWNSCSCLAELKNQVLVQNGKHGKLCSWKIHSWNVIKNNNTDFTPTGGRLHLQTQNPKILHVVVTCKYNRVFFFSSL